MKKLILLSCFLLLSYSSFAEDAGLEDLLNASSGSIYEPFNIIKKVSGLFSNSYNSLNSLDSQSVLSPGLLNSIGINSPISKSSRLSVFESKASK